VALPDAPDGTSLTGQRHLPAYADAIGRAIDFRPLSRRTARLADRHECRHLAAVNGAAHLGSKVSRAVLTSSVTRRVGCGEPLTHPAE